MSASDTRKTSPNHAVANRLIALALSFLNTNRMMSAPTSGSHVMMESK
jgi:hypothetical protein